MISPPSVPAILTLLAGGVLLALIVPAFRYRDVPGAPGWIGLLAATGLWGISYGIALTVFDPEIRVLFEVTNYGAMAAAVICVIVAGLTYTGYERFVHSRWMAGLVATAAVFWGLIATNALGLHTAVWRAYSVEPVLGAAAATFRPTPLFYLIVAVAYGVTGAALLVTFGTMVRFGRAYRRRAALIFVSGVPIGVAHGLWLLHLTWPDPGVSPVGGLDLTPMSMLLTAAVNGYVLYRGDFFDVDPATRRNAQHAAFDQLATAVVMVNTEGIVVGCNATAQDVLRSDGREAAIGRQFDTATGVDLAVPLDEPLTTTFPAAPEKTYELSTEEILDARGQLLGYTVSIQDVTRQRRRQQRLEVFNRVLRHNLRNDLNVIEGNAARLADRLEVGNGDGVGDLDDTPVAAGDPGEERDTVGVGGKTAWEDDGLVAVAATIIERTRDLSRTAEKARDIARAAPGRSASLRSVDVLERIQRVQRDVEERYPAAEVTVDARASPSLQTDGDVLELVLENVVENAVVHADVDTPQVDVRLDRDTDPQGRVAATITVEDAGPGIPQHELDVLAAGEEDQLHHGSGMGLWIISWGIEDLGGDVTFDVEDGTSVTLTVPDRRDKETETPEATAQET